VEGWWCNSRSGQKCMHVCCVCGHVVKVHWVWVGLVWHRWSPDMSVFLYTCSLCKHSSSQHDELFVKRCTLR
jgi:hypothetical protein